MNVIRIDSNEPKWIEQTIKQANPLLPYKVEPLMAGDLWIETNGPHPIIFERKTVPDLMASIKDRRLANQIKEALDITPHVFLIVEGNMNVTADGLTSYAPELDMGFDYTQTGFSFAAVWGVLTKVQRMGAYVRFYRDVDLFQTLQSCIRMIGETEMKIKPRQPIDLRQYTTEERILMAFDGIGEEAVKALLQETGSAAYAIWYLSTPLDTTWKIPGIGPKTREKALAALGHSLMPFDMSQLAKEDEPDVA